MNTKSLLTRIGVPVLSLGLLGGLGATLATSASAAVKPPTVTANTHLNNHPDTTDVTGPAIGADNVWAYDNATEKYTLVQDPATGVWTVTMDYVGSFHGFADPRTGVPRSTATARSRAPSPTTVTVDTTRPDPSRLPGQSASDAHIRDNILTLFGDPKAQSTAITGGDVYTFSYQNGNYTQIATPALTITGDVTGH